MARALVISIRAKMASRFKTVTPEEVRGFSFERNCVLRLWESETLKQIINHKLATVKDLKTDVSSVSPSSE